MKTIYVLPNSKTTTDKRYFQHCVNRILGTNKYTDTCINKINYKFEDIILIWNSELINIGVRMKNEKSSYHYICEAIQYTDNKLEFFNSIPEILDSRNYVLHPIKDFFNIDFEPFFNKYDLKYIEKNKSNVLTDNDTDNVFIKMKFMCNMFLLSEYKTLFFGFEKTVYNEFIEQYDNLMFIFNKKNKKELAKEYIEGGSHITRHELNDYMKCNIELIRKNN